MYYKVKCPKCKAINKDVNLDESEEWELVSESEKINDNGHIISFCTYNRR